MPAHRHQRGESLPSLLIGLSLGLLVVAAGIRLLGLQWLTQREQLQQVALQQDLQAALGLMLQELQQAQHLPQAWQQRADGPCSDALCEGDGALRIGPSQVEFATDRNRNGLRDNNECSGFRLRAGALQHKTACQPAVWTAVTDSQSLPIVQLDFRLDCQRQGQRLVRRVAITLQTQRPWPAATSNLPAVTTEPLRVQQQVTLRNDLPVPSPGSGCPAS